MSCGLGRLSRRAGPPRAPSRTLHHAVTGVTSRRVTPSGRLHARRRCWRLATLHRFTLELKRGRPGAARRGVARGMRRSTRVIIRYKIIDKHGWRSGAAAVCCQRRSTCCLVSATGSYQSDGGSIRGSLDAISPSLTGSLRSLDMGPPGDSMSPLLPMICGSWGD